MWATDPRRCDKSAATAGRGGRRDRGGVGRGCGRLTQDDATRVQQQPGVVGVAAEAVWVGNVGDAARRPWG